MLSWLRHQPVSVAAIGLLILVPLLNLQTPRGFRDQSGDVAESLVRLVRHARLIQSFEVDPTQSVPQLWQQRFGRELANSRWQQSSGQRWWMVWTDDGAALLVLLNTTKPGQPELHFADELHQTSYEQNVSDSTPSLSTLELDCLNRLSTTTAVQWNRSALISIAGSTAALLDSASNGCLSLSLEEDRLRFSGPVGSQSLSEAPDQRFTGGGQAFAPATKSKTPHASGERLLLRLSSREAASLLSVLASRPMLRDQLETRYGVTAAMLQTLLDAPMQLSVRAVKAGPFKAGLQCRLHIPLRLKADLERHLNTIATVLRDRDLRSKPLTIDPPKGESVGVGLLWMEGDQAIGGWFLHRSKDDLILHLSLGQPPFMEPEPDGTPEGVDLALHLLPRSLAAIGWLNQGWPDLIRRSSNLELVMAPIRTRSEAEPSWSRLQGQLSLR